MIHRDSILSKEPPKLANVRYQLGREGVLSPTLHSKTGAYLFLQSMSQGKIGGHMLKSCSGPETKQLGVGRRSLRCLRTFSPVDRVLIWDVGNPSVQVPLSPEGEKGFK